MKNAAKTAVLLAALGGLFMGLGQIFGGTQGPLRRNHRTRTPQFATMFATHPPTTERINRLRQGAWV